MKKYRLIKEYPGSPTLNTIITIESSQETGYYSENKEFWEEVLDLPVGTKIRDSFDNTTWIKKQNDIWEYSSMLSSKCIFESEIGKGKRFQIIEEVVEKDYEILSFRANKKISVIPEYTILNKEKDNIFRNHTACTLPISSLEDKLLNNSDYNIHSVKRLSDGEVFQLGDKCNNDIIKEFKLYDNNTRLYITSENKTWGLGIEHLKKDRKKLFTTEDGKEIFEDDRVYCIFSDFSIGFSGKLKFKPTTICFSSKEKAEEYILMNKPCLSINDVNNCYPSPKLSPLHNKLVENLKELVKSKL